MKGTRNFRCWLARAGMASLLLALSHQALAAAVQAEVDRRELIEGETVTLVLQTHDTQQSLDADFAGLEPDFQVIDRRSETQMSIVNGRQAATVRLLLTLEPRRSGRLQVPALEFPGGAVTAPITLDVRPAPELAAGERPPVFIETQIEPQEGPYYVHAQLSLKVRIFYQQNNLTEAAINPPTPELASVRLLDEVPYQADRDGHRYKVLERRYAIFPERSGEMTIPPMQLTGRLIERPADRLWQPSVRGRRIRVESDPLTLTIKPRPPGYSGAHWLPARRVSLAQQISDADELRVGEPVTRTVILDAVGLEEHMLEEPVWPALADTRIYPDRPQGISRDDGEWVLGHREFRYAVVPETPGELVLPELRLHWWDTVADRERTAVLPEHRVRVLPSTATALAQPGPTPGAGSGPAAADAPGGSVNGRWRLLAFLFAALWLVTLVLYWRRPGVRGREQVPVEARRDDESKLLAELRGACRRNDAATARRRMAEWLRRFGPVPAQGRLMRFASKVADGDLAAELRALDALRFAEDVTADWQGEEMWRAFQAWRKNLARAESARSGPDFDLYRGARATRTP